MQTGKKLKCPGHIVSEEDLDYTQFRGFISEMAYCHQNGMMQGRGVGTMWGENKTFWSFVYPIINNIDDFNLK